MIIDLITKLKTQSGVRLLCWVIEPNSRPNHGARLLHGVNQLVEFIPGTNQSQNTKGPIRSHTPPLKAQSGAILLSSGTYQEERRRAMSHNT